MKNYEQIKIDLPKNVEAYLRRNAEALLAAPSGYVVDVFTMLTGQEEMEPKELEVLSTLLRHFVEEKAGTKKGILGVIDGGKAPKKVIPQEEEEPEIRGIVGDIRMFHDIPEEERQFKFQNEAGKIYTLQPRADFILDGKLVMVADYLEDDSYSFFYFRYAEDDKLIVDSVQDKEEFELIGKVWDVIQEAVDAERAELH